MLDFIFILCITEGNLELVTLVLPIHAIFLTPSISIHVSPETRKNITFRIVASLISIIVVAAGISNYFLMINEDNLQSYQIYYTLLAAFSLPGAIISASFLVLLTFGVRSQSQKLIMMTPQHFQSIHIPMV